MKIKRYVYVETDIFAGKVKTEFFDDRELAVVHSAIMFAVQTVNHLGPDFELPKPVNGVLEYTSGPSADTLFKIARFADGGWEFRVDSRQPVFYKAAIQEAEFELTGKELEEAYRVQEHNYMLQDAENHLMDDLGDRDQEEVLEEFGATVEEMCDPKYPDYALETLVSFFNEEFSCDCPEYDVWEEALRRLKDVRRARKKWINYIIENQMDREYKSNKELLDAAERMMEHGNEQ